MLVVIPIGIAFVLLGRWLYRNPGKLVPVWGVFNSDHSGVQKLARAYATFLIFFGLFASLGVVLAIILRRVPGMPLLCFAAAAIGAWLLRPKLIQSQTNVENARASQKPQSLLSNHWKRNLAIVAGIAGVFLLSIFAVLSDSDISKLAFTTAQTDTVVQQRLGTPLKRGFFTSGSIETSGPSGRADIAIPISGPKSKGTLYAVARKSAGFWKFDTLQIAFDGDPKRVDLLANNATPPEKEQTNEATTPDY
jgi:hypothetical protein